MNRAKKLHKFDIVAYCILPDHFHWIIDLHDTNGDFSKIMHSVKLNFSRHWRKNNPSSPPRRIWQARFWDHVIRDEKDLSRHIDYIHWNPVKHMIVMQPNAWIASSFQFHLSRGFYDEGWGSNGEPQNIKGLDWE
jgi:putative transposase